jgi:hypothetical protein
MCHYAYSADVKGLYCYESIFHAYRVTREYSFYLFTHDDAVVQVSKLEKMLESRKSYSAFPYTQDELKKGWSWEHSVSLAENRLFFNRNSSHICSFKAVPSLPSLASLPSSPLSSPSLPSSVASNSTGTSGWIRGQSDWFLLKREHLKLMEKDASEFRTASLFLEVAIPTLFGCLRKDENEEGMEWSYYNLSTTWTQDRRNSSAMEDLFCSPSSIEVFPFWSDILHPLKFSDRVGLQSYLRARECKRGN